MIECKVNRYYGHFEGDAQTYRAPDEVKKIRETRDCIARFSQKVTSAGLLAPADLDAIDREVMALIDASVVTAKAGAKPVSADLLTDVYVSY